jgi:hypothetical protein
MKQAGGNFFRGQLSVAGQATLNNSSQHTPHSVSLRLTDNWWMFVTAGGDAALFRSATSAPGEGL